jgi:hypothetical protein
MLVVMMLTPPTPLSPTTISSRSHVAQDKGGPNRLLTRSMSGCDVEQFLGSFRLSVAELVNQRVTCRVFLEH